MRATSRMTGRHLMRHAPPVACSETTRVNAASGTPGHQVSSPSTGTNVTRPSGLLRAMILAVSLMDGPLATMALAQVIAFMMFAFPRTPAAIMPALAAFPRPVPAPGAIGAPVGVWNRSLDEAARKDCQGHHDQDPRREPAHFAPLMGRCSLQIDADEPPDRV